jgi:hypothetical protein
MMRLDGIEIKVGFINYNCMNDGKTLNAVSTEHYRIKGIIPLTQKEISTQKCHLCLGSTKDFQSQFEVQKPIAEELLKYGCAPLHEGMRSIEAIINAAARKRSVMKKNIKTKQSVDECLKEICREIKEETGARLFEPEPEKQGNSNIGPNLKIVLRESEKTAQILDCHPLLLQYLQEILGMVESLTTQDPEAVEQLCRTVYSMYQDAYGAFSGISPSLHRLLQHTVLYMLHYQSCGLTIGQMSEQGQEATNADSKTDRQIHSFRGNHEQNNMDCFTRSWWSADPYVLFYCSTNK